MNHVESQPLSEVRKTLRPKWYRIPIDPARLREFSKRSDRRGFFQALVHMGLWGLTGLLSYYCFSKELWVGFVMVLFLHGTLGSHFSHAHHELCHGTVFRTKWLNLFFLKIFCLFGWLNFHIYKMSHSYHHRFTCFSEGDREVVLPREPSLRIFFVLQLLSINFFDKGGLIPTIKLFIKIAFNRFDTPFNSWTEDLYENQLEERRKAVNWARLVLIFHGVILVVSFSMGEPILAVLLSGHVFIGGWHHYFLNETQHDGLRSNVSDFRKCTRTMTLNPVSEFLYWHMNWHLEHHMFAGVPCYNLKKLHQVISDDMPKPRTLYGAWHEMRETWRKQQAEPEYEFDTPVPVQQTKHTAYSEDPLTSSIGDLAPKSLA